MAETLRFVVDTVVLGVIRHAMLDYAVGEPTLELIDDDPAHKVVVIETHLPEELRALAKTYEPHIREATS